jgi:hypothetical protein
MEFAGMDDDFASMDANSGSWLSSMDNILIGRTLLDVICPWMTE